MWSEMKYVYAVYESRSFSKAAQKMFITQPALSAMVKKAEMEIGCQIFDRSTVPVTVTEEGQYYIDNVRAILETRQNIERYYQDLDRLNRGHISIGGSSYFCAYVLSGAIGRFREQYPNVKIDLLEGNLPFLIERLGKGELDLIIETAIGESDASLVRYLVGYEDIILCVPAKFPVNQVLTDYALTFEQIRDKHYQSDEVQAVPLDKLRDTPFLLMKQGNDMYKRGLTMCRNAGFTPQCSMYLDQILTSFFISQTGTGAVFMRASLYEFLPSTDRMVYYKLADPLARRPIYMASKKGRYLCKAATQFLETMGAPAFAENAEP